MVLIELQVEPGEVSGEQLLAHRLGDRGAAIRRVRREVRRGDGGGGLQCSELELKRGIHGVSEACPQGRPVVVQAEDAGRGVWVGCHVGREGGKVVGGHQLVEDPLVCRLLVRVRGSFLLLHRTSN